ncbi:SDR family NAD(P)-dependent oxidoreductase [Chitinophaga sedimenti]|uniref:SDR family NAD(P)-dependent oxidoreductase n=1 Tax=Chitinophaga sedimenti TaxID=2033606 RepID=UPI00249DE541|nr:SDR family NAD(P)-dependent oxidoreductase [Chitinophaga sedimenti]
MEKVQVWLVTGASKGLGLSLVKQLLTAGHRVAATSRNLKALTSAVGFPGKTSCRCRLIWRMITALKAR